MSPFTRNIALAAAAALLPALVGFAMAPERARALPHRIGHRVRDLFDDEETVEGSLRRITARLEDLSHQIDRHGTSAMDWMRDTTPTTRLLAGLAALLVIPAALTAIFAPAGRRSAGSRVAKAAPFGEDDQIWEDDFGAVEENLEKQRSDAVSAASGAARRDD